MLSVPSGKFHQIAFVVEDLAEAMEEFATIMKIGPWFYYRHLPVIDQYHRGKPTALDLSVALAYDGTTMFELIEQQCDRPSVYRETVARSGYGFHHIGITTRDFDADVERHQKRGSSILFSARTPRGNRGAYMDGPASLSGLLEYIEVTDASEAFYNRLHQASLDWDGRDPARPLD